MADRKITLALAAAAVVAALVAGAGLVLIERASAGSCLADCKTDQTDCRMKTKDSLSCAKKFTRCILDCGKKN